MRRRDFDAGRRVRATSAPARAPLVAGLAGRDIRFTPDPPPALVNVTIGRFEAAGTDDVALLRAVLDLLDGAVLDADRDALRAILTDTTDPIGPETIAELWLWLLTEWRASAPAEAPPTPAPVPSVRSNPDEQRRHQARLAGHIKAG